MSKTLTKHCGQEMHMLKSEILQMVLIDIYYFSIFHNETKQLKIMQIYEGFLKANLELIIIYQ
jgi:hypothetical protein